MATKEDGQRMNSELKCHYCGAGNMADGEKLRPYGPGYALVCFTCVMSDPEREAAAAKVLTELLNIARTKGKDLLVTPETGPLFIDRDHTKLS